MIHIYTGKGKGKTTAAYGLGMRAKGWDKRVCFIQFLKSKDFVYGETISAKRLGIKVVCLNQKHPLFCNAPPGYNLRLKEALSKSLSKVRDIIASKRYGLIVLDEIINALDQGYIKEADVLGLIKATPSDTELVLTGRGRLSRQLARHADYFTRMQEIKHPFRDKVLARRGIEF